LIGLWHHLMRLPTLIFSMTWHASEIPWWRFGLMRRVGLHKTVY